jgi:hypothetical protein
MTMTSGKHGFIRALGLMLGVAGLALCATLTSFAATPGQAKKAAAKTATKAAAAKPEAMFPHMDAAMGYLKAADQQLKQGEPVFYGHRINAMKDTEAALADLQKGINDYMAAHPGTARNEAIPEPPPAHEGDKYPHMNGAAALLKQAEAELNEASKIYTGGRVEGLAQTRAAVNEINVGMKEAIAKGK